jgi:prophage antirepressor-like protein
MSNEVTVFTTPAELGSLDVRVTQVDGNPMWRLDDVCRVLEHTNPRVAAARLDDDEKGVIIVYTLADRRASPSSLSPGSTHSY